MTFTDHQSHCEFKFQNGTENFTSETGKCNRGLSSIFIDDISASASMSRRCSYNSITTHLYTAQCLYGGPSQAKNHLRHNHLPQTSQHPMTDSPTLHPHTKPTASTPPPLKMFLHFLVTPPFQMPPSSIPSPA